ncbi:MAG: tRNA (N(6)-L-threonylcarbamoyladenosine(37)-C(2))-methylthiotransferase MtaB [Armatimonadota bacterium]|nr:MAG: tRNA (N(6)-L-threonylcarbamoyladenosine(37)-C(2))-methylthiotransferase MtaB [Armatimonadota bacterium]
MVRQDRDPRQPAGNSAVRIATLGCKANQADSDALAAELIRRGYTIAAVDEPAAVCVINTCTVTHVADAKARKLIRRLGRDNPRAAIVVTGCYAERAAQELAAIPGVSRVVPNAARDSLARVIEEVAGAPARPEPSLPTGPRPARPGSVRAFVKAQDGCDHHCSYCIVPAARGPMRSRSVAEVVSEIRRVVEAGAREVVVSGIRLGAYGEEPQGRGLARLLHAACDIPAARLRLSSIEPWDVGDELAAEIAEHPLLCPHLHLPLQSGDDEVLRAMRRPYTIADYRALVHSLRQRNPDIAVTTDIMVGFPGESERAFAHTCSAVEEIGFARAHVFRYSGRPGTTAAAMPDQVPDEIKAARAHVLSRLAQESACAFARRFMGRTVPVLFEECANGVCSGLTDTYLTAKTSGRPSLVGQVAGVEVRAVESNGIAGELARRQRAERG